MIKVIKKCKICGVTFSSVNRDTFTCSNKCLAIHLQRKERDKKEEGYKIARRERQEKEDQKKILANLRIKLKRDLSIKKIKKFKKRVRKLQSRINKNLSSVLGPASFYETREWREIRYSVIRKYGRKCQACFAENVRIHVDHIKPRSTHPNLELVESNLQILCEACNLGKSNKDETDWRPK